MHTHKHPNIQRTQLMQLIYIGFVHISKTKKTVLHVTCPLKRTDKAQYKEEMRIFLEKGKQHRLCPNVSFNVKSLIHKDYIQLQ